MHTTTYQDSPTRILFLVLFNLLKLDNTAEISRMSVLVLLSGIDSFRFKSKQQEKSKKKFFFLFVIVLCTVNCKYIERT